MAGYNEIRGLRVKYLSADPSNAENGQVWYNSTTNNLRVQGVGVSAWSSGGNLITARRALGGAGTQTAGLGFSGYVTGAVVTTEEYNGNGWATGGNMGTGRYFIGGAGTQTAGLAFGGFSPVTGATEEFTGAALTVKTITTS